MDQFKLPSKAAAFGASMMLTYTLYIDQSRAGSLTGVADAGASDVS